MSLVYLVYSRGAQAYNIYLRFKYCGYDFWEVSVEELLSSDL